VEKLIFWTITCIDIAHAVSRVSSFMAHPQQAHLEAAMHILRYIRGTLDHDILYQAGANIKVSSFIDTSCGSCLDTRRSMGGFVFTLAGGPINWQSMKQLTVSKSST
jgi:hypothetical protein